MLTAEAMQVWPELGRMAMTESNLAECSDRKLAQAAGDGDMRAFEEVYLRHHRSVYRLCLRMTQNVHEAEDLTQEVFVHLFRKIGTFRGESAFSTWLHRLTVNHVLMHFRKHKGGERTTEDGETPNEIVQGTERPGRMQVVDRISLDAAIAQLSPGYRAIFILHDVEGYQHDEIAGILGCSVGTSKSQLHKARLRLRKLLSAKPKSNCMTNNF
ncbi:MAG TPA: RNA polymerase sigma factor [Pyrinomonadaceae bacterium]|jgi:RNA polymerase sigma-70 factor (ECF subfamily)